MFQFYNLLPVLAVFFTILLLTGNTMAQSIRERIPELAILKTLGFSDVKVTALVLAEALLLILLGAGLGMGVAAGVMPAMNEATGGRFPPLFMSPLTWAGGLGLAVVLALAQHVSKIASTTAWPRSDPTPAVRALRADVALGDYFTPPFTPRVPRGGLLTPP